MTVRSKRNSELKWLHSPTGELFRLAWPIAVSMVSHSVMTLVDTLFVGRLGPAALAAVGVAGITAFTIVCFPMGVIGGVKILVSQAVGAGRRGDKSVYLAAGLVMAAMGGLVCVGAGQLVATLIPGVTASVEAGLMAQVYLSIRVLGAPATLAFTALREYRVALGDSRWPMVSAVLANVFNVILDWLLIVVLDQGVAGAAWATVAASAMQALVLWFSPGRSLLAWSRLRSRHLRAVWRLGAPGGAQWLLEVGSFTAMSWMIAAYGELDMAAHQIAIQVIHFSFLPQAAVAEAASVLTGQAVGANRDELVPGVARRALASAGKSMPASMAIIAITTRSSINVNARTSPAIIPRPTSLILRHISILLSKAVQFIIHHSAFCLMFHLLSNARTTYAIHPWCSISCPTSISRVISRRWHRISSTGVSSLMRRAQLVAIACRK